MNIDEPIRLSLDRERVLRYDFAAFRAVEERTGVSIIRDGYSEAELRQVPFFLTVLWAGLVHEDPGLTLAAVEKMIFMRDFVRVKNAVVAALHQSAGHEPKGASEE